MSDTIHLPKYISEGMGISRSEARRLIAQGAVMFDGEQVTDLDLKLGPDSAGKVLAVGHKRKLNIL